MHERNRGELLATRFRHGKEKRGRKERRRRREAKEEPKGVRIDLSSSALGPFRILDQRESYANPPLSLSRI